MKSAKVNTGMQLHILNRNPCESDSSQVKTVFSYTYGFECGERIPVWFVRPWMLYVENEMQYEYREFNGVISISCNCIVFFFFVNSDQRASYLCVFLFCKAKLLCKPTVIYIFLMQKIHDNNEQQQT